MRSLLGAIDTKVHEVYCNWECERLKV